ncbi:MAG: hypothetical protein K0R38_2957 [Polyangiaceae bacterium]|nr:hypothetical protein [Polyangiaceae bacterium]
MLERDEQRCLWELTPEQQRHRPDTTRLLLRGSQLLRLDRVSGSGAPHGLSAIYEYRAGRIAEYSLENPNGVLKGRNVISEDGRIVRWLDEQDRPRRQSVTAASGLDRQLDASGRVLAYKFVNLRGEPTTQGNVCETRTQPNAAGATVALSFFGKRGQPVVDEDGAHRLTYVRDRNHQRIERRYFDTQGRPAELRGVHLVRFRLDAFGNDVAESFYDAQEQAVVDEQWGAAALRYERDDHGNEVSLTLLNAKGQAAAGSDGFAFRKQEFDERDQVVETRYFDAQGTPVVSLALGAAGFRQDRDTRGNVVAELLFDAAGAPTRGANGYHRLTVTYDARDNPTRYEYTDLEGLPVDTEYGYASRSLHYDGDRITREDYFGADGRLASDKKGHTGYVMFYFEGEEGDGVGKRYQFAEGAPLSETCDGTISAALQSELTERASTLRSCYERVLRFGSVAEGKVVAELSIDYGGQVLAAKLVQDQLEEEDLSSCVLKRMSEPYLSKLERGDCVTVRVPMTFQRKSEGH